ncbi:transcriptional regulator, PadR family [Geoglobus ahangari]|uniref:Transcriptional regulator, PadR family n=1 Tax=Geoglobus ahangari TaxID=113653 RepID=A0A0F7IEH6_9EURY|nr:PadR family transcriptional regulator [Geoglobus ahangari]AKG91378.1 transcriptional regulator, PadR family [Geoglobus ahangari]
MTHLKGILKILILKELEKESLSGLELIDRIEKKTAKRPSPGSVYPLLKELQSAGFLEVRAVGKSKVYSLSELGRRALTEYAEKEMQALLTKLGVLKEWGILSEDEYDNLTEFMKMKRENFLRLFELRNWVKFVVMLSRAAAESRERAEKMLEKAIECISEEVGE